MLMRSPPPAPLDDPVAYYASVTLHGTVMAYVLTTFFIMGFGYAVAATSLGRPVRGMTAAWIGFAVCLLGTVIAAVTILAGRASVLYTFYPPLLASSWYYAGVFLLVGGSMIWVVLMIINMLAWKRDNPGEPVPLAMFAITATALLWAWSASGVVIELLSVILPAAFGWATKMDAGLGRTLFSVLLATVVAGAFAVPAFAQDVASMACSDYAKLDDAGKMALMADLQSMNAEMASSQEVSSQDIASYLNTECASKPDRMLSDAMKGMK